jgi:hypothetical protein
MYCHIELFVYKNADAILYMEALKGNIILQDEHVGEKEQYRG